MAPSTFSAPQGVGNAVSDLVRRGGHGGTSNNDPSSTLTNGEIDWEMYTYGLNGVDNRENFLLSSTLLYSLAFMLFLLVLLRIQNMLLVKIRHILLLHTNSREALKYWATPANSTVSFIKKHILWAPVGRIKHNREIRLSSAINFGTLPTRLQAILLLTYFGSNVVYCTILLNWDLPRPQLIAEFRGRTGVLAVVNMMPLFLLAGRNNPLIWLFGIPFDTWNLIHRWMGRVVVLESTCHIVAWTINKVETSEHGWRSVWEIIQTSPFVFTGLIGGIAFLVILFQSPSPIRHAAYETFLYLHIALAATALVGVFYHLKIDKLPQIVYMFTCIAFWSYDRLGRLVRILYRNCGRRLTRFRITALPGGGGACRVDIEMVRPWKYSPGSHAYIYLPWVSLWQSHPFSIAWSNTPDKTSDCETEKIIGSRIPATEARTSAESDRTIDSSPRDDLEMADIEKMMSTQAFVERARSGRPVPPFPTSPHVLGFARQRYHGFDAEQQTHTHTMQPEDKSWSARNTMSMVLSKRTGMTKSLWEMANRCPNKTMYLTGFIEGEYGAEHGLYSYGMVVLIAGGVGITHCLGWARELLTLYKEGRGVARKVVLIWVVPDREQYEWCREWFDEIFAIPGWEEFVTIQLYVSRPKGDMLVSPCANIPAYAGRPDWDSLFTRFAEQRLGTMGVTVCGPGTLSDSIRLAVRKQINHASIDFLEESFTW